MLLHAIVNHHGNNHSVVSLVASGGLGAPFSTRKGKKYGKTINVLIEFSFVLFFLFFFGLCWDPCPPPPPPFFSPLEMTNLFFPSNY
jgi:hypothetical protein